MLTPNLPSAGTRTANAGHLDVLAALNYKPGWTFRWQAHAGPYLTLVIEVRTWDSDNPADPTLISHNFTAPPLHNLNEDEQLRWIFERILDVERHEAREFFRYHQQRPFPPEHGPESNPYR